MHRLVLGLDLQQLGDAVLVEPADGLQDAVALMAVRLEVP